jgi:hypothetical protein
MIAKRKPVLMFLLVLIFCFQCSGRADDLIVGGFSEKDPAKGLPATWQKLIFPKIERQTSYTLMRDNHRTVIQAVSNASASGLIRYFEGSAERYPWIAWQWKIEHVLNAGDVSMKQGDDYAARIYVAFEYSPKGRNWWQRMRYKAANLAAGGKLPGTALNYIWANKAPRGTVVSNPFTDQTKMIVLQSGDALAGRWLVEKRNLVEDYRAAFGYNPPRIMGIAIMTDTDNTGESTTAYYGDIQLSDE